MIKISSKRKSNKRKEHARKSFIYAVVFFYRCAYSLYYLSIAMKDLNERPPKQRWFHILCALENIKFVFTS